MITLGISSSVPYGLQFVALMDGVLNGFQKLLKELGIKHLRCRVHSPETDGKIERFWKSYYFRSLSEAQRIVDQYVDQYNYHRLNKGLDYQTPAERYWVLKG